MPYVIANGARLYYEEHGSGAPILCVHGAGSSARAWERAARTLSDLGRVIIYDRRGCTRSERPDPYEVTSVREHAEDAHALLRALDAEPAVVIGRSYGGTVGLDLALRHPESVRAVALLEAGPMELSPEYDRWFESLGAKLEQVAADRGVEHVAEVVFREVFGAWEELPDDFRAIYVENGQALLAEVRGGERLTETSALGGLRQPSLVVHGEDSPEPLQDGTRALVKALPAARVVQVAGGHLVDPADPAVLSFVTDVLSA